MSCTHCNLTLRSDGERCAGCRKLIASQHEWHDHADADCDGCEVCASICWESGECEPPDGWRSEVLRLRAEVAALRKLAEYAGHRASCAFLRLRGDVAVGTGPHDALRFDCDCGFADAKRDAGGTEGGAEEP